MDVTSNLTPPCAQESMVVKARCTARRFTCHTVAKVRQWCMLLPHMLHPSWWKVPERREAAKLVALDRSRRSRDGSIVANDWYPSPK